MTKIEWDALTEDAVNSMCAVTVLGWHKQDEINGKQTWWLDGNDQPTELLSTFQPTTDRNACALVLDEIEKRGLMDNLVYGSVTDPWIAPWLGSEIGGEVDIGAALRADPDTICYCAVKAVEDYV